MTETRRSEIRAAPGRRLVGPAMRYGAEARVFLPDGSAVVERFATFAFSAWLRAGGVTRLNIDHQPELTIATTRGGNRGNLELQDHPTELRMIATLPSGDVFDRVLALVADGSVAETSVEFLARHELRSGGRRTVTAADLPGVAIVDHGAYGAAGAVEVRRRGYRVSARVDYGRPYDCGCAGPRCTRAQFEPGAFDDAIADTERDILAVAGEYRAPLASMRKGSLRLTTDDAGMLIDVDLPDPDDNDAARVILQVADATGIYARPYSDRERSESTEQGDLRIYSRAWLRAIVIGATDAVAGWTEAEVIEPRRAAPEPRRVRPWL